MANTYTSICLHLVFAVKNRDSMISPLWQKNLHAYLAGILTARGHRPIIVGGTDDHVHLLFKYNINERIPDLVRELKISSGNYIRENRLTRLKFNWQTGYACFSCDSKNLEALKSYIANQFQHHKGRSLREEMVLVLTRMGIDFDVKYIFEDIV
ncbi:MAG: IS200/IS605 family transposase [Bacteroides sp.]|nr:IS200/IS605 family transposase [Bacteroides sp.]